MSRTLLVALAHPDDEVGCAGTIAAHRAAGDRVVMLFLTRGEMTESLGPIPTSEVARRRTEHAHEAGRILDAEVRVLDFPDTRVEVTADGAYAIAREIADIRPDCVITWGDAWVRGPRHPDHQASGQLVRNAVTIARIAKAVAPIEPHRGAAPIYAMRDPNSVLPLAAVDVTPYRAKIDEVAAFYRQYVRWPDPTWLENRLAAAGTEHGVKYAELFDVWDGTPGVRPTLTA
ncbi:MAG TPA: PIG-L family deacetylase [Longimicrobiales bacterium]